MNDPDIQSQVYQCFLLEASSILSVIEQDLLSVLEERNINKIHSLMRNAHTLKGSAASAERETIRTIAHHLEDVFKALYDPNLKWDEELSALLWECYECLRESVTAEVNKSSGRSPGELGLNRSNDSFDETKILNQLAVVFAQLQTKLGDFFAREAPLPTSDELGFDVIGSIFAESMQQELQELEVILATNNPEQIAFTLRSEAEFFIGIAESYNLPGMKELAQTVLTALEQHPERTIQIAQLALEDFHKARIDVIAGDRSRGGQPSVALQRLAKPEKSDPIINLNELIEINKSKLAPETENIANKSENKQEESLEPEFNLELVQREQNDEPSEAVVIPLEQQEPNTASDSRQSSQQTAVEQILQEIQAEEQELESSENSDFSPRTPSEPSKKTPKSPFSSPSSGQEVRVNLSQLDSLNYIFGELLINQNQQTSQTNQSHENTHKTLEQLQQCQTRLSQIRDWANKYLSAQVEKLPQLPAIQTNALAVTKSSSGNRFDPLEMDTYGDIHILIQSVIETMMQLQDNIEEVEFSLMQSQLMLKKQKKLLTDAQENLLQARTLPIGILLNRFPLIIKQLVNIYHKPAQLELNGTQILVDKSISEKLFDPLLHLVRNAIAHGIESSEVRRQQGKSETGRIKINAYHQGNRTTIEVVDDGQGLNWERIRQKSIEQQLLDPHQAEMASESELTELLFEPGFSTAEKISDLSGRGVGLDAVRSQIAGMQGSVTVRSVAGKGTVFSLHLPLVLITAEMLVCQSKGLPYALLAESIERVLQPEPNQISYQTFIQGHPQQKFLLWGEGPERQQIPIRTLASLLPYSFDRDSFLTGEHQSPQRSNPAEFLPAKLYPKGLRQGTPTLAPSLYGEAARSWGFPQERLLNQKGGVTVTATPDQSQQVTHLLMIRQQDQLLCLEVEHIDTQQELAIKSFSKKPTLPSYIQGYSVLSSGGLVMALDPLELVRQNWSKFASSQPTRILPDSVDNSSSQLNLDAEIEQPILPPSISRERLLSPSGDFKSTLALQGQSILIIEDSPTQRKLLFSMLEKAGCYVIQAADGQEALTQLSEHPEIKLIICDIEMPTMNGFEFLYTYRQDSSLSQVDVIMLTSRSGHKHRQMAFELGARAYLTKPYSEQELLGLISDALSQQIANV